MTAELLPWQLRKLMKNSHKIKHCRFHTSVCAQSSPKCAESHLDDKVVFMVGTVSSCNHKKVIINKIMFVCRSLAVGDCGCNSNQLRVLWVLCSSKSARLSLRIPFIPLYDKQHLQKTHSAISFLQLDLLNSQFALCFASAVYQLRQESIWFSISIISNSQEHLIEHDEWVTLNHEIMLIYSMNKHQ